MATALWHMDKDTSIIKEAKTPKYPEKFLEIKSEYSLVSTGTERLVSLGMGLTSAEEYMAVPYMEGHFSLPIKYGYSLVGKVISKGEHYGKHIHVMHPHQTHCWVNESNVTFLREGMQLSKAPLVSNLETIINAIWDSQVSIGDRVMIAGFGNIGVLLAETLRHIPGISIYIHEIDPWRKEQAEKFGFNVLKRISSKSDFDIAFDTTASSNGLQDSIKVVKEEGKVINLSWYGTKQIQLSLGGDFHYGRKQIISSQVSKIPHEKRNNWDFPKRKSLAMDLLMKYSYEQYIDQFIPFEESPHFYHQLRKGKQGKGLIWCIKY